MTPTLRERTEHAAKYGAQLLAPACEIKQLFDELDALRTAEKEDGLIRAIAVVTPCTCSAQRGRAEQAEARIEAVRKLHSEAYGFCVTCTRGRVYHVPAPCDTAAALAEGGDDR